MEADDLSALLLDESNPPPSSSTPTPKITPIPPTIEPSIVPKVEESQQTRQQKIQANLASLNLKPKELRFVMFTDCQKTRLPPSQMKAVILITRALVHERQITFDEYIHQLRAALTKQKYDSLYLQFCKNEEQKMQQNIRAGATADNQYPSSTGAIRNRNDVNVTVRSSTPPRVRGRAQPLIRKDMLQEKVTTIASAYNIGEVDEEFYQFLTLALQERLRTVTEDLVAISRKRVSDQNRGSRSSIQTSNIKEILKALESKEEKIAKKRREQQTERLLGGFQAEVVKEKLGDFELDEDKMVAMEEENVDKDPQIPSQDIPNTSTPVITIPSITFQDMLVYVERDLDMKINSSVLPEKLVFGKSLHMHE